MTRRSRLVLSSIGLALSFVLLAAIGLATWHVRQLGSTRVIQLPKEIDGVTGLAFTERCDFMLVVGGNPLGTWNEPGPIASVRLSTGSVEAIDKDSSHHMKGGWAISDDGETVVYGVCDRGVLDHGDPADQVRVWSVREGRRLATFDVPSLAGIAFSPDGRQLIEGRLDRDLKKSVDYRDVVTGKVGRHIDLGVGYGGIVRSGREFLLAGEASKNRRAIEVRLLASGEPIGRSLELGDLGLATSTSSPLMVTKELGGFNVREVPSGRVVRAVKSGREQVVEMVLSREGDLFAILSPAPLPPVVELFSVETGTKLATWPIGGRTPFEEVSALAFVPGEDTLAIGTTSGRIELHPFRR